MYDILKHAHSGFRWVVLFFLLLSIITAVRGWSKQPSAGNLKVYLFGMVSLHIQFTLGLVLYFINLDEKVRFGSGMMENDLVRFYTIEHLIGMLLATVLVTIGRKKALASPELTNRKVFTWYLVSLVIIMASIPWPGLRDLGGSWF